MCDPVTLGLMALSGGAALFGGSGGSSAPAPPPPVIPPAPAAMTARDPGAEVKIGDGAVANKNSATPQYDGFTEKRVTGRPLGGLGRGGLGL